MVAGIRHIWCLLSPDTALDTLGHHAVTCRRGGDVVTRHNCLCDTFVDLCRNAHLSVQVEVGNNLTLDNSRQADVLVGNWDRGKPAALDFTVFSPLSSAILSEASANTGAATRSAEERKHRANDVKCAELGWSCVTLAVETYGTWVMRHNASFLAWLLFALWDLHGPRVRYYLTFMAILTSNLCVPLQELC